MNKETFSDSKPVAALAATTLNSGGPTVTGETIDTQGFRAFVVPLDFVRTTDGQIETIQFQESDDGSTGWATIDDSETLYYPDDYPLDVTGLKHAGCVAKKRYIRILITAGAFSTGNIAIPKTAGLLQCALTKPPQKESSVLADSEVISPDVTADAATTPPKR